MTGPELVRPSVDTRSRGLNATGPESPEAFWTGPWKDAMAAHGERAAADAELLGLPSLTITVDGAAWTWQSTEHGLDVRAGADAPLSVAIDQHAFADLVCERRTALGLVIGGRAQGDPAAIGAFCAWDPVLRSVIDGRGVHRPGDVTLRAADGRELDLGQSFRFGADPAAAAHFLAEAGFLLLRGVFSDAEMDVLDADFAAAVTAARVDDGESWWAATRTGDHYPCRLLNFERKSAALRELFADPRFLAIGEILSDGHRPGDPFGEHFSAVTAEGLTKRVGSVEGFACLPWHKDCDRGGHSMYCSGLTIGICLTPVDAAHGGLDVMAGSHRANIARTQTDRGLDLPVVGIRADRGDVTVHLSCALHRSTHPERDERRVVYTGFTLPPRGGDLGAIGSQTNLERERAAIGDPTRANIFASTESPSGAEHT